MTKRVPYGLTDGRLSSAAPQKNSSWCPGRVLGAQHRSHPPGGQLVVGAGLVRHAGVGQGAADGGQRLGVADLPAGGEQAFG